MKIGHYDVHPLAAKFPPLVGEEFDALVRSIDQDGLREPITLAPDGKTIVDGCNRLRACIKANRDPIFTTLNASYTEFQIIGFIINANIRRRHLDKGWLAAFAVKEIEPILAAEAKRRQQEHRGTAPGKKSLVSKVTEVIGRTRDEAATMVGVANGTVAKAEKLKSSAPNLLDEVLAGQKTLQAAFKEAKAQPVRTIEPAPKASKATITLVTHENKQVEYPLPKSKPTFNPTNDFIGWAGWSWNPVSGCLHGCPYCYARELALRDSYRAAYPVGFTPLFHHERLDAPANTVVPESAKTDPTKGRVFVCSMADLYGRWVPEEWIARVHEACRANPQWEYLMLTKFPSRYVGRRDLPPTAWLGTSVDEQKRVRLAEDAFRKIDNVRVKWLSLEPLLAPLKFSDLSMFDWIVIGSQTQTVQPEGVCKAFAPPFEWVARIVAQARKANCRVFLKENLMGQAPGMLLPKESPKVSNRT